MVTIAGHELTFVDCAEIGQGGPEACTLLIDDRKVARWQVDPHALEYRGGVLIPVRKSGFFSSGYALAFIDPVRLKVTIISKVFGYMRLVSVDGDEVTFNPRNYGDDLRVITVRMA
jgi:hypothetical protein